MRFTHLPVKPPYPVMDARLIAELPEGAGWQYEPKWDGFRCLAFRDADDIELQAKSGKSLTRYFPEVVVMLKSLSADRFVVDSELVIAVKKELSFEQLQLRLHPAESRVRKLANEYPATMILFDLLVDERGEPFVNEALQRRREQLELFHKKYAKGIDRLQLSPATTDVKEARAWFEAAGSALDGIVAKRLDLEYRSGDRTGMVKYKNVRSVDCVVGGFRYLERQKLVGSLLLGLFEDGLLHHVGYTSSISGNERKSLTRRLEALRQPPGFTGRSPGGPSRWSSERSGEWEPLKPELVVEVKYDHFSGGRFRHGTKFIRWRPDKAPSQCTFDQVKQKPG